MMSSIAIAEAKFNEFTTTRHINAKVGSVVPDALADLSRCVYGNLDAENKAAANNTRVAAAKNLVRCPRGTSPENDRFPGFKGREYFTLATEVLDNEYATKGERNGFMAGSVLSESLTQAMTLALPLVRLAADVSAAVCVRAIVLHEMESILLSGTQQAEKLRIGLGSAKASKVLFKRAVVAAGISTGRGGSIADESVGESSEFTCWFSLAVKYTQTKDTVFLVLLRCLPAAVC
jgi:hypothetical protein